MYVNKRGNSKNMCTNQIRKYTYSLTPFIEADRGPLDVAFERPLSFSLLIFQRCLSLSLSFILLEYLYVFDLSLSLNPIQPFLVYLYIEI